MTFVDKSFRQFWLVVFLYFFAVTQLWIAGNNVWLSDKFYVFQYCILFSVGLSKIDSHFILFSIFRLRSRISVGLFHYLTYIMYAVLFSCLCFFELYIIMLLTLNNDHFAWFFSEFFSYLGGSILLSSVVLLFRYSFIHNFNKYAPIFGWILLVLESQVIIPQMRKFGVIDDMPTFFTRSFAIKTIYDFFLFLFINFILFAAIIQQVKRRDFLYEK